VPKLRQQKFETAIIERNRRRESSAGEALIEIYMAGVSVRSVSAVTQRLWGSPDSPGTVSNPKKKIYEHITRWRTRLLEDDVEGFRDPAECKCSNSRIASIPTQSQLTTPDLTIAWHVCAFFCASQ
jgi:hypothetical protein